MLQKKTLKNLYKFSLLSLLLLIGNYSFGQFTLDGSTLNSGDYTCGTSTISQSSGFVNGQTYTLTICASPGEVIYLNLGSMTIMDNGGTNSDDILTITDGGTILYEDGPENDGVDGVSNVTGITGINPGGCLVITLLVNDGSPQPEINATIGCLPAPNAGSDQSPGDCSTSTTLSGNDVSPATGTWTVSPSAGVTITAPNNSNSTVTGMTAGADYTFTWTSNDGTASSSDDMIFNSAGPGCHTYCTLDFTDCDDEVITGISMNGTGIASSSSCPTGSYSDETAATCIDVDLGIPYNLCVDITMTGAWTNHVWAFFDWDNDGTFETAEDMGQITNSGQLCLIITVPAGATTGNTVMRIVISETGDPTACSAPNALYGDVIDICINVLDCSTTIPNAGPDQILAICDTDAVMSGNVIAVGTGTWSLVSGAGTITTLQVQQQQLQDYQMVTTYSNG